MPMEMTWISTAPLNPHILQLSLHGKYAKHSYDEDIILIRYVNNEAAKQSLVEESLSKTDNQLYFSESRLLMKVDNCL